MEGPKFIKPVYLFFFCITCISCFDILEANFTRSDEEYWRNKEQNAQMMAQSSYDPKPESATNRFNRAVNKMLKPNSTTDSKTERLLREKYNGPCLATNPIDRCWRCRKNWATDRKRLATCVKGFAHGTTGGSKGKIYVVTDPSDHDVQNPKYGTLRWGAIQPKPLWIVFSKDMIITLTQELMISSDKTLDGRGANVHIAHGAQLTLQFVHNVIIHNLHIHDIKPANGGMVRDSTDHCGFRTQSDGDGITVFGSSKIWIDHISMSNCADGLIDIIQRSTAVTISNCHFTRHNDVLLMGASDSYSQDKIMQVTLAFNHFGRGLVQRMPRCRWGFFHVVNNDYTHWLMYAVGGSKNPTIISQGNRYIAPPNFSAKEVTKREYTDEGIWKDWIWKSQGDLMQNGAFFIQSGSKSSQHFSKTELIKAKPGTFVTRLTRFSGALNCHIGKKC